MYTYHYLAKVRVAGSNPVFRSKHNRRSGTLSRVPVVFLRPCFALHFDVSCHFRATLKSGECERRAPSGGEHLPNRCHTLGVASRYGYR